MKRIALLIMTVLLSLPMLAQFGAKWKSAPDSCKDADELFAAYSGREGYQTVVMGQKMLQMMQKKTGKKSDMLNKIKQIRILSSETSDPQLLSLATVLGTEEYELISFTDDNKETTGFYINDSNSEEKQFLMVAHRADKEIVMEITGSFDVADISQLSTFGTAAKQ